jgi:hypothetical protein
MSIRVQNEFNCKDETVRVIYGSYHSGKMASGDIVSTSSGSGKWIPVAPGSLSERVWKYLCEKQ